MPNNSAVMVVSRRSRDAWAPAARTVDQMRSVKRFAIAVIVAEPRSRASQDYGGAELRLVGPRWLPATVVPSITAVVVAGSPEGAPLNR